MHADVYDRFTEAFVAGMSAQKVGDPMADGTDVGPLATSAGRDGVAGGAGLWEVGDGGEPLRVGRVGVVPAGPGLADLVEQPLARFGHPAPLAVLPERVEDVLTAHPDVTTRGEAARPGDGPPPPAFFVLP